MTSCLHTAGFPWNTTVNINDQTTTLSDGNSPSTPGKLDLSSLGSMFDAACPTKSCYSSADRIQALNVPTGVLKLQRSVDKDPPKEDCQARDENESVTCMLIGLDCMHDTKETSACDATRNGVYDPGSCKFEFRTESGFVADEEVGETVADLKAAFKNLWIASLTAMYKVPDIGTYGTFGGTCTCGVQLRQEFSLPNQVVIVRSKADGTVGASLTVTMTCSEQSKSSDTCSNGIKFGFLAASTAMFEFPPLAAMLGTVSFLCDVHNTAGSP